MNTDIRHILNQYQPKPLGESHQYAVLLPLIWQNQEWQVLYQVRSESVSQPGEISFPGGALEAGETYQSAAIRETMEELNLPETAIELLGEIDYIVYQNRSIHCFVGQLHIDDWHQLQPNQEVARLFTVSLERLKHQPPTYYQLEADVSSVNDFPFERIRNGKAYQFGHHKRAIPFYDDLEENLWGLTAQLTHRFTEILEKENVDN